MIGVASVRGSVSTTTSIYQYQTILTVGAYSAPHDCHGPKILSELCPVENDAHRVVALFGQHAIGGWRV